MKYVKIAIAVLLALAVIVSAYFLFFKEKPQKDNQNNESVNSVSSVATSSSEASSGTQSTDKENNDKENQTSSGQVHDTPVAQITRFPFYINRDLKITNVMLYNGAFIENSSFDIYEKVFAIKLENCSKKDLQLARIYITTDRRKCFFEVTALPAGETVVVLEKNASTFAKNEKLLNIEAKDIVYYPEKLTLDEKNLKITGANGSISVENISKKDIDSDIYVYYKHTDGKGNLVGGATFRTKIGKIKAGKLKQTVASAYFEKYSKVVFVDYVSK